MNSFPVPDNESGRLAALASYSIMDTLPEIELDEITLLASEICQAPIALISLLDEQRQWFKSHLGLDVVETPKEQAFCSHAIMKPENIMVVKDAREDLRFNKNPLVTGDPNIVFYAGVPLLNNEGFALGTLCVIDRIPRELSDKQMRSLEVLARQVLNQLELRRKLAELQEANKVLEEANSYIRQFALSAAHDIKNPLSAIKMTSQLLQKKLEKSGDETHLKLVENNLASAQKLLNLVNNMLDYSFSPALLLSGQTRTDLIDLLNRVIGLINPAEHVDIKLPEGELHINCSVIALEQIFLNLLTNAIRYNDKDQTRIQIRFSDVEDAYHFEVEDNGIGIDAHHLEKIFEKHVTLNLTDRFQEKGTGIGLASIKGLVEKLDGKIQVTSEPGKGSTFRISLRKHSSKV